MKIKQITYIALFSSLIAIGAFIKIPVGNVPFTLQPLFVMLSALVLDKKSAIYSVLIYIIIGLIGIPIFARGGGIGYIFQPTFGYLLGFLFAVAFITSFKDKMNLIFVCVVGIILIYVFGISYFVIIQNQIYGKVFTFEFMIINLCLIFLPTDLISMIIAIIISKKFKKVKF